jgi:hypothetical protein
VLELFDSHDKLELHSNFFGAQVTFIVDNSTPASELEEAYRLTFGTEDGDAYATCRGLLCESSRAVGSYRMTANATVIAHFRGLGGVGLLASVPVLRTCSPCVGRTKEEKLQSILGELSAVALQTNALALEAQGVPAPIVGQLRHKIVQGDVRARVANMDCGAFMATQENATSNDEDALEHRPEEFVSRAGSVLGASRVCHQARQGGVGPRHSRYLLQHLSPAERSLELGRFHEARRTELVERRRSRRRCRGKCRSSRRRSVRCIGCRLSGSLRTSS